MSDGPVAAWYADPAGSGGLRYWDGGAWTEHVTAPPGRPGGYGSILAEGGGVGTPPAPGRRLWPLFVVIGVLFVAAVIAGVALAVPRIVKAGSRVTDVAARSTVDTAVEAGAEVYALEGSYLGATPERLETLADGLTFTQAPSTEFTTVSVQAEDGEFTVAVASLSGKCFVAIIGDEVGAPRRAGRLADGLPCWASFAADQVLVPVQGF